MRRRWRAMLLSIAVLWSGIAASCSWLGPDSNLAQAHPWTVQPIRKETKDYFCAKLGLSATDEVCQVNRDVFASDLLPILEKRFPINQTQYSEVADVLNGYPVDVQDSKLPDGTITTRRYLYLLTEFDGYCVAFSVRDVQSGIVTRIYGSSIGSGPTSDTCTSPAIREPTRPWLKSK